MRTRRLVALTVLAALPWMQSSAAIAGCGCDKPPPPLASVRPAFASPGDVVTLFPPGILEGETYHVRFGSRDLQATATRKRDFADGVEKLQLAVAAPDLPPGPTLLRVRKNANELLRVEEEDFTMLQRPLALGEVSGLTTAKCYRAAVGSDGTVYFPFDIEQITDHMIFGGLGANFPLLFDAEDVAIYNTQGVLMQLLGPNEAGIFSILDLGPPHSFALVYDRHEFNTYRAAHAHQDGYGLDPSDPAWHTDGTRHVDHDHLVLAIRGTVEGEGEPEPGATEPFDLVVLTALADQTANAPMTETAINWSNLCN